MPAPAAIKTATETRIHAENKNATRICARIHTDEIQMSEHRSDLI
jgi:hypothetical protein